MESPLSKKIRAHLGRSESCPCGREHRITTEAVHIGSRLGGFRRDLERWAGGPSKGGILIAFDRNTWRAAGPSVGAAISGTSIREHSLIEFEGAASAGPRRVDAGETEVEGLVRDIQGGADRPTMLLAVGSGTVNDIVKMAAARVRLPYAVFGTAPSMNGYTSAIAALKVAGVKMTLPATAPVLVASDPVVLDGAPARMCRAGVGDLLSKPVAAADWRMAHLLRGEYFCQRPVELVDEAVEAVLDRAKGMGEPTEEGARTVLFEALLLSGMSMASAGSSSPASGGEHLISHFLDMAAPYEPGGPRQESLHGEQVGVATRVSLRLYGELLSLPEDRIDWEGAARKYVDPSRAEAILTEEAGFLPAGVRRGILDQAGMKLKASGDPRAWLKKIRKSWEPLREDLAPRLADASRVEEALLAAGCPTTAADIGVSPTQLRRALRLARFIRNRYTVLDLAADLGILEPLVDGVLEGGV